MSEQMIRKNSVIAAIDEVMNNREIDSIRNAILAIRDKVKEIPPENPTETTARLLFRGGEGLGFVNYPTPETKYVYIDTYEKLDTGAYGAIWYE